MIYRIVYVDDEPHSLKAFKRVMRNESFECITFASARLALKHIPQIDPVVVISDQRMPEMPGTDFLEQVKAIRPKTIRIILTSYPEFEVAMAAINQGNVYRFLEKPWEDQVLIREIYEAIQYHEALERSYGTPPDFSEQKEQRREKLKGVLEMAGAVSHAMTQPIQIIQGYVDIMQMSVRENHQHYLYLINLQQQITRMRDIIKQVQSIKRYQTCRHAGNLPMVDLEKSSADKSSPND